MFLMFCEKCGNELSERVDFCPGCGRAIAPSQEQEVKKYRQKAPARNTINGLSFSPETWAITAFSLGIAGMLYFAIGLTNPDFRNKFVFLGCEIPQCNFCMWFSLIFIASILGIIIGVCNMFKK